MPKNPSDKAIVNYPKIRSVLLPKYFNNIMEKAVDTILKTPTSAVANYESSPSSASLEAKITEEYIMTALIPENC